MKAGAPPKSPYGRKQTPRKPPPPPLAPAAPPPPPPRRHRARGASAKPPPPPVKLEDEVVAFLKRLYQSHTASKTAVTHADCKMYAKAHHTQNITADDICTWFEAQASAKAVRDKEWEVRKERTLTEEDIAMLEVDAWAKRAASAAPASAGAPVADPLRWMTDRPETTGSRAGWLGTETVGASSNVEVVSEGVPPR